MNRKIQISQHPEIIKLYSDGLNASKIGKIFNVGHKTICKVLKDNNIVIRNNIRHGPKIGLEHGKEIIELYINGMTAKNIAKQFGVGEEYIVKILLNNNIEIHGSRKYKFNENYFDNIDSEEKAYILGFLYADGCNHTKRGVVTLAIDKKDIDILVKINKCLGSEKPIRSSKKRNIVEIEFSSRHLSDQLIKLGCVARKSLILEFPTEEQVPKHLDNHFIRGYFDGDGCIYHSKLTENRNYVFVFNIMGTEYFCGFFGQILNQDLNVNYYLSKRFKDRETSTRSLTVGGNQQVRKVLDYLYLNSTIYLQRKYDKYKLLIESVKVKNKKSIIRKK